MMTNQMFFSATLAARIAGENAAGGRGQLCTLDREPQDAVQLGRRATREGV